MLTITAAIAAYAAGRVGDGLGPVEARRAVADAAAELEAAAASLRRLARLTSPADRRALAAELGGDGMSQRQIARTLGVSRRRAWDYLHDRSLAAAPPTPARLGSDRGSRRGAQGGP